MTAADVERLLARHGGSVLLRQPGAASYDPAGGQAAGSEVRQMVRAVVESYAAGDIDGTLIRGGDSRLLVSAVDTQGNPVQPTPGARVTVGGCDHSVQTVEVAEAKGAPLLFILQLRS